MRGALAGMIGGIVASWAANQFHSLWSALRGEEQDPNVARVSDRGGRPDTAAEKEKRAAGGRAGDDATEKVADKFARAALGHPLKPEQKHPAGVAVHYLFGAVGGVMYGAAAEVVPPVTAARGVCFGVAVWLTAVETALPAFKLSKPPWKYPPRMHVYSFLSHVVFGAATEAVRSRLRRL